MSEPLAIAFVAWNRPEYTARSLAALGACDGIGDAVLHAHVEPGNDEVRALVEGFAACEVRAVFNPTRLGCVANTGAALGAAFGTAEYATFVEDDILPAPDFLEFHRWARGRYRGDSGVSSAAAYHRRPDPCPPADHYAVRRRVGFHGWGCGSWRDRLGARLGDFRDDLSWDTAMDRQFRAAGLVEVHPLLSRVQNIGLASSFRLDEPDISPGWYLKHHYIAHWAGNAQVAPGAFFEVA